MAIAACSAPILAFTAPDTSQKHVEPTAKTAEVMAIQALREFLSDDTSKITRLATEPVQWSDASLGCPKVGLHYPQVVIPGYRVSLNTSGKRYNVHTGKKRAIVCVNPDNPKAGNKVKRAKLGTLQIEKLTTDAKRDLAAKIFVKAEDIQISSVTPVTWPDTSLGCSKPGKKYKTQKIKGFRFVLENRGREYSYHADRDQRVFACPEIEKM